MSNHTPYDELAAAIQNARTVDLYYVLLKTLCSVPVVVDELSDEQLSRVEGLIKKRADEGVLMARDWGIVSETLTNKRAA